GLHARAAWAQGARHVRPDVGIVTCFCGAQDDNELSRRHALAVIAQGADVLYTMLNAGRQGAIDACREKGVPQIGNVIDWCAVHPDVFIASAIADNGRGVLQWLRDATSGKLTAGEVRWLGMEDPQAVRLAMAPGVPAAVRARIDALADELRAGRIVLETEYVGAELAPLG
ncbi:MAG: BMP family ABC transporter substrate-binding protein, partial [Rubrivivax sp.]